MKFLLKALINKEKQDSDYINKFMKNTISFEIQFIEKLLSVLNVIESYYFRKY